jgi:hypothetical protein
VLLRLHVNKNHRVESLLLLLLLLLLFVAAAAAAAAVAVAVVPGPGVAAKLWLSTSLASHVASLHVQSSSPRPAISLCPVPPAKRWAPNSEQTRGEGRHLLSPSLLIVTFN